MVPVEIHRATGEGEPTSSNNQIKPLGNKSFPKKFPEFYGWLKNWKRTPDELGGLEQDIQEAGKGNENKGVEKWIGDHPGIVDEMAPVTPVK
ncbi:hypothetical protein GCM10010211_51030 [Streptomyces albospinus]|uniref:ABC-type glycine betaine transport system substrate-binding domain-containing protein n=1 Tax=Streptomyces albospinus TaxID=285515 RepID=A0ABQ2VBW2_9ACTN|nr:glycine betaine ABC transporter substrate-binding protein [Streptomyces albospinus]GGU78897.1 hypothetical protein GCM10010211_51030 [Streptomyces albospinus]